MTNEDKLKILQSYVTKLSEIYEAVQVFATGLNADNTTFSHKRGSGNWYARQGMAQEFIQENIASDAAEQIAKKLDPPDEWSEK